MKIEISMEELRTILETMGRAVQAGVETAMAQMALDAAFKVKGGEKENVESESVTE